MLGVARAQMSDEDFRQRILEDMKQYCGDCVDEPLWDTFTAASTISPATSTTKIFIPS